MFRKRICCYSWIVFLIALTGINVQAQSIRFESSEGELKVNGKAIVVDDQIQDLTLDQSDFSLQMIGNFPMLVDINGVLYEVWDDRIVKATRIADPHYRLLLEDDGTFIAVESSVSGDLDDIANRFSESFEDLLSTTAKSGLWESLMNQASQMSSNVVSLTSEAANLLEFSNYLTNVRDGSSELFELLRNEWKAEIEAMKMAASIQRLEPGTERDEAIEELRKKLEVIFLMKQENRKIEIKYLEMEVDRLQQRLMERSEAKDRLIDARLNELLAMTHSIY